jgi:hypothetical protein
VVIDDLNTRRTFAGPDKTKAKLIVDPNRVLALPISFQSFQSIAGWLS